MNDLAKQGVAIIMISSELPEVINMSDRVIVMSNGTITACLPREELSQEKIMKFATQLVI
jgi:ABC-type sugar transport system ATPase subunit